MPVVNLTDLTIRKLKQPERGDVTYFDKALRGFGIRCSKGSKTFFLLKGEKRVRLTLGRYPIISLAQAREKATELLAERTLGTIRPPSITFEKAKERFLEAAEAKNKPRTVYDYRRLFKHYLTLSERPLDTIQAYEVGDIISALKGTPTEAVHAYTTIRAFFRFCRKRGLIHRNPIEGMGAPAKLPTRDRVLSLDELKAIYTAAGECGTFGTIVRLLMLTGQRRTEIASLHSSFFDQVQRTLTFPKTLTKNGRQHTVPFGDITEQLLTIPEDGLLFPARGKPDRPFNGWGKSKAALDEKLPGMKPWTLHDLRRTFATNLSELGVLPHVVEKMLNHASGTIKGVAAIYNRHRFITEMRGAVGLWETRLKVILSSA